MAAATSNIPSSSDVNAAETLGLRLGLNFFKTDALLRYSNRIGLL
jgi:hypothetical protein